MHTSLAAAAMAAILLCGAASAAPADVLETGIVNGALVFGHAGTSLAVLAHGGGARGLPCLSPDGTRIAFTQVTDPARALADVVVVAPDGRELSRTPIEPVLPDVGYTGMQYVDGLRWISGRQLAVRGAINPAQSQYYVVDAAAGKIVSDFVDDGSRAAFSPDGRQVARLADSPHYVADADRTPALLLDGKPVWQAARGGSLASEPRFSADGASLAWADRDAAGKAGLDIYGDGALHHVPLPAAPAGTLGVYWAGSRAVATASPAGGAGRTLAWSASRTGAELTAQLASDPAASAEALRATLQRQARAAGVQEPDFWCASCALSVLPRGGL